LFFGCGSETVADAFLTSADVFGPSLGSVVGWISVWDLLTWYAVYEVWYGV
jgi:hypothetical protein